MDWLEVMFHVTLIALRNSALCSSMNICETASMIAPSRSWRELLEWKRTNVNYMIGSIWPPDLEIRMFQWRIHDNGSPTKKNNITKRLVRIDSFQSTVRLCKKNRFLKSVGILLIISLVQKICDNRAMGLVSGSRHSYRDEVAILTNMAPSSLGDGGFIQLKGQRDACKKVGGMDFVSTQNAAGVPYFTFFPALKWLVHTTFFLW